MLSSGSSAKTKETQAPTSAPTTRGTGAICGVTSTGRKSASASGSRCCTPTPSATPRSDPAPPRTAACSRYARKTRFCRAPMQRSTATPTSRCFT